MKNIFRYGLIAMVAIGLSLGGCKKDSSEDSDDTVEQKQMAEDESRHNAESESSLNEANDAIGSTGFGKKGSVAGAVVEIDTPNKKITITYNGNSKDLSRWRTGVVTVQLTAGTSWKDAGATIVVTYKNFKVMRNLTQKALTFDGSVTVVNQTGGKVFVDATVVHLATSSDFKVTFEDGTQRTWNLSRKRTFTLSSGIEAVKTEGTGTANNFSNLISWGTNRKGHTFYTQITTPVVYHTVNSTKCPGLFMSGAKVHKGLTNEITVTAGVDESGNAYTGANCPYGYKLSWTNGSKTKTAVIPY